MEMNQQNQVRTPYSQPEVALKKKRGRPRKDRSQNPAKAYVPRKRGLSQTYGASAPIPPGFEEVDGSQTRPADAVNDSNMDSMVGQVVTGVIEAVFDAGFLLSVRVGNSDINLRGVVFKSGHYVPVCAENDIAPGLQMIRRNEVPFPVGNHGRKRRGRERSEHHAAYQSNGSPSSNQVARIRARQLAIVPAQSPTSSLLEGRGTLVPVVLQPANLSNGATPAVEAHPIASQPAHLAASKGKHACPIQVVQETSPKGLGTYGGSVSQPFNELVTTAKKMTGAPNSAETQTDSAKSSSEMLPNDSSLTQEEGEDLSKPLCVEPLQAIHLGMPNYSAPMSHTFPERRTGKMTELLMAVQENLMERQISEPQHQEFRNLES